GANADREEKGRNSKRTMRYPLTRTNHRAVGMETTCVESGVDPGVRRSICRAKDTAGSGRKEDVERGREGAGGRCVGRPETIWWVVRSEEVNVRSTTSRALSRGREIDRRARGRRRMRSEEEQGRSEGMVLTNDNAPCCGRHGGELGRIGVVVDE
ncbi:hypothetical protein DFP72DRAFT_893011, partial [Ephemerocybe angulata]